MHINLSLDDDFLDTGYAYLENMLYGDEYKFIREKK